MFPGCIRVSNDDPPEEGRSLGRGIANHDFTFLKHVFFASFRDFCQNLVVCLFLIVLLPETLGNAPEANVEGFAFGDGQLELIGILHDVVHQKLGVLHFLVDLLFNSFEPIPFQVCPKLKHVNYSACLERSIS